MAQEECWAVLVAQDKGQNTGMCLCVANQVHMIQVVRCGNRETYFGMAAKNEQPRRGQDMHIGMEMAMESTGSYFGVVTVREHCCLSAGV